MTELYCYREPTRATRTLKRLRRDWPTHKFEVVLSPSTAYMFKYIIKCVTPAGKTAFVEKY